MPSNDLSEIEVRGYSIVSIGKISERKLQSEFWSPAGYGLEDEGFAYVEDIDDSLNLPDGLRETKGKQAMTAVFGADDALVAVLLYLGVKASDWAINKVCDGIWEGKLRGALGRMLKRRRAEGYANQPMTVCFGVWYDEDRVYIGAVAKLTAESDAKLAELIPLAQRRGLEWIKANGVTKPVIVFPIENDELASVPTLRDSIPG